MRGEPAAALRDHTLAVPPPDSAEPNPLTERLARADIVGLGEATHGTQECFEHKGSLVRRLVADAGFRTVAFEVNAVEAMALDAFVDPTEVEGPSTALEAVGTLSMWQWRTESVAALLDWIRAFNAERPVADRVVVRGVDLSEPAAPAARLVDSLDDLDTSAIEDALSTLADASLPDDAAARERRIEALSAAAGTVAEWLPTTETAESASVERRHLCRLVRQNCAWHRVRHEHEGPHPSGMAKRDELMAENAALALDRDTGAGVALWAHDEHIQRGRFDDGRPWTDVRTMGERLDGRVGDGYVPVGFDLLRGSFRAVGAESSDVGTFSFDQPLTGTATAQFRALDTPIALSTTAAGEDSRLDAWLRGEPGIRSVGSVFDPEAPQAERYVWTDLPHSYDWLLVVAESSPTRPVGTG